MIQVECECGRVIKTNDANAGKKARCPECGEIVQIPAPRKSAGSKTPTVSDKGAVTSAVKSARKRPPVDEDEFAGGDESFDGDDDFELPAPKSKKASGKKSSKASAEADEPAPKKKKKKKGGDSSDTDLNKNIIIGTCVFFGLAFLGLIGYGIANMGSIAAAPAVEVPKEFADFSTTNGELKCQGPKGWPFKTGGGSGGVPPFLTIEQGSVKIQFRSSPSGSAMSTIQNPNGEDTQEMRDEDKPVTKMHEFQKRKFLEEKSGYQEHGADEMIKTANSEGRLSTFTASEGFSTVHGYRVTLIGTNNQWNIVCQCSAGDWKAFQEIFRKVIASTSGT